MLVLLLSVSVCSVSAAGTLTDFFDMPPTSSEFYPPAGPNSIVVDLMTSAGFPRRYVFPESIEHIYIFSDSSTCVIQFLLYSSNDCVFEYYGADFSGITKHYASTPSTGWFEGTINVGYTVTGLVTNGSTIQFNNSVNDVTVIKPFPDAGIAEERKTQGMISQLISDIKDWFSNLIDSMGNFFTELGNKISSGFTALGDRIKGFFTQLVEDIKGLFVPSDGFFDDYSNNFELWAREHFGFLFETLEIVDTAINKYVSFSPSDDFVVTLPEASFTVKEKNYVLWEQQTFSVNSLLTSIPALSMFHTVYFTFVYALFFYLLYRLGEKAYTDIFGGSD